MREEIYADYRSRWPSKTGLYDGTDSSQIALTFDDGPNEAYTLRLLDVLAKHQVMATFFVVGKYVKQHPDIVRAVHTAGHVVGNHTESHPDNLAQMFSSSLVLRELDPCQKAIEDVIGVRPKFFRPPYGRSSSAVEEAAEKSGLQIVMWSVIPVDYEKEITADRIEKRVHLAIGSRKQGEIVLLHDGDGTTNVGVERQPTVDATDKLLGHFIATGKRFVSLQDFKVLIETGCRRRRE